MGARKLKYHTLPGQMGLPLDLPGEHYQLLHHEQRGVVIYWSALAESSADRWLKLKPGDPRIPDLFRSSESKEDRFITVNEFDGWRYIRLLRSLRACYVDLDDNEDMYSVLDRLADAQMPGPSLVVWSGSGMHIYWLLDPLPAKCLPVWQRIQDKLIATLKPVGADAAAKDCTRLLRIVGSRNKGEEVHALVLDGHRWGLRQLAFEVLGSDGKGRKPAEIRDIRARRKSPDRAIQGSIYARWHLVFQDLVMVAGHHHNNIPEGYRDKWLFLAGVALSWFTHAQGVEDEIVSIGQQNTDLASPEIRAAIQPSLKRAMQAASGQKIEWQGQKFDPRYRFRRQTLYDWIGDLIPDSLLPKMRAIIPFDEGCKRKKGRNSARYATSYTGQGVRASNEEKRATARLLRAQGHTYRAIADEVGVSVSVIHSWCKNGVR
jgi:hypothetical protein